MTYLRLSFYLLLTLISVYSMTAAAQHAGRWYQVELLIFKRNTPPTDTIPASQREEWPTDISLAYPEEYRFIEDPLPSSEHQLGGYSYALTRNEQFEVLFHQAWDQQMWEESRSTPFIIRAGQRNDDHWELEGSINIHIGRFLHLTTDLWLSEFIYGDVSSSFSENAWPILPILGSDDTALIDTPGNNFIAPFLADKPQVSRAVKFTERRSMRSKETHYMDHPEMGIIVRMLPIEPKN
jgi:hypothetical protein